MLASSMIEWWGQSRCHGGYHAVAESLQKSCNGKLVMHLDATWTRGHLGRCCSWGAVGQMSVPMVNLGVDVYLHTLLDSIQAAILPEFRGAKNPDRERAEREWREKQRAEETEAGKQKTRKCYQDWKWAGKRYVTIKSERCLAPVPIGGTGKPRQIDNDDDKRIVH